MLAPGGQFGTRLQGGKDAASPRYIFTKLPAITRAIFHSDDDPLLNYLNDDGQSIEPGGPRWQSVAPLFLSFVLLLFLLLPVLFWCHCASRWLYTSLNRVHFITCRNKISAFFRGHLITCSKCTYLPCSVQTTTSPSFPWCW